MARGALTFKETDVARAIRAAKRGGMSDFCIRIARDTGDILILPAVPVVTHGGKPAGKEAELDDELAEWEAGRRA